MRRLKLKSKLKGAKLGVELSKQENDLTAKQKAEGFKIGLDVAKDLTEPDTKERV